MFKIVAMAYLIVAGQPFAEPLKVTLDKQFVGLDGAQERAAYLNSAEFTKQRRRLNSKLSQVLAMKVAEEAEKNREAPPSTDVAITASCEEDHSL
jgi:hypothetical protein